MSLLRRKRILHILLALIVIAGFIYFFFYTKTGVKLTHSNVYSLTEHLKMLGIGGKLIGMLLVCVQTFFPFIPFVVVAGTNVAIFGLKWGFVVNYSMSCLAAAACFLFARYFGYDWVEKRIERYPVVTKFSKRMESQGFVYVLIGRLIPILPSSMVNLAAGLTRISFNQFLFGTLLGKLPIVLLESLIAHDLFHFHKYKGRLILLILIFVALIMIGNWLKKVWTPKGD